MKIISDSQKQMIMELHGINRYSYKTIAETVGLPWQTVKACIDLSDAARRLNKRSGVGKWRTM